MAAEQSAGKPIFLYVGL